MIRKANLSDVPKILSITQASAQHMIAQGIYQWNEHYPSKIAFENDILRDELFVLEQENEIIGTIVVSSHMDEEYIPISWNTPNENNTYIHRLTVHPKHQKKGFAQQLMSFAENLAKQKRALSVRLDTFSKNPRNIAFYTKRGYHQLGDIYFPKQSEHPFHCFELIL